MANFKHLDSIPRVFIYIYCKVYKLVQNVIQKCVHQTSEAYHALDPIKVDSASSVNCNGRSFHFNIHFQIALFCAFYLIGDSVAILYGASWHYSHIGLPALYTHRIFPKSLWLEGDILFSNISVAICILYCFLMFSPWLENKYLIYVTVVSKKRDIVRMEQNLKGMNYAQKRDQVFPR